MLSESDTALPQIITGASIDEGRAAAREKRANELAASLAQRVRERVTVDKLRDALYATDDLCDITLDWRAPDGYERGAVLGGATRQLDAYMNSMLSSEDYRWWLEGDWVHLKVWRISWGARNMSAARWCGLGALCGVAYTPLSTAEKL